MVEWAIQATELGAGEIIVTSVDRDGTGQGFDIELMRRIVEAVNVPVVASGGAGTTEHVTDVVKQAGVQAVSLASLLHYPIANDLKEKGHDFGSGGEFKVVGERISHGRISGVHIRELKMSLVEHGVACRIPENMKELADLC